MPAWKEAKVWSNLRYYVLRLQFISLITTNSGFIWSEREFYILSRKFDSIIWPVGGPKIYVTKLHGQRRSKNTDSFTFKTYQTFNLHPKLKNWFNYLTRGGLKICDKVTWTCYLFPNKSRFSYPIFIQWSQVELTWMILITKLLLLLLLLLLLFDRYNGGGGYEP